MILFQVNREYLGGGTTQTPPLTTCFPLSNHRNYDLHQDPESRIRLEKATGHGYAEAMYLTVGIGALLLGINVWFLLCMIFCRSKITCCLDSDNSGLLAGKKDNSVETDLMGLSNADSVHNIQR